MINAQKKLERFCAGMLFEECQTIITWNEKRNKQQHTSLAPLLHSLSHDCYYLWQSHPSPLFQPQSYCCFWQCHYPLFCPDMNCCYSSHRHYCQSFPTDDCCYPEYHHCQISSQSPSFTIPDSSISIDLSHHRLIRIPDHLCWAVACPAQHQYN